MQVWPISNCFQDTLRAMVTLRDLHTGKPLAQSLLFNVRNGQLGGSLRKGTLGRPV